MRISWICTLTLGLLSGIFLCILGIVTRRWGEDYHKRCLYLALLDDMVCRRRLKGMELDGRDVAFPPKKESLWFRYQLFLERNRSLSDEEFAREIRERQQELVQMHQEDGETRP